MVNQLLKDKLKGDIEGLVFSSHIKGAGARYFDARAAAFLFAIVTISQ